MQITAEGRWMVGIREIHRSDSLLQLFKHMFVSEAVLSQQADRKGPCSTALRARCNIKSSITYFLKGVQNPWMNNSTGEVLSTIRSSWKTVK